MDLLRLEQQRQALEQSLQKLRTSLKYWQTFEAEYEGFKEEIEATTGDVDLVGISQAYSGELVNEKEIRELSGLSTNSPRTVPQILGMISRRQEYVQKNIETVQRQFWDAEAKLEELDFAAHSANRDGHSSSGGLPLTEIHEELDEEGNIISTNLSQPELSTSKLVAALQKAGMSGKDLSQLSTAIVSEPEDYDDDKPSKEGATALHSAIVNAIARDMPNGEAKSMQSDAGLDRPPVRKKSVSFSADTKPAPVPVRQDSEDGKKCVSFAEKVAVMPSAPPPDTRSVSFSPQIEEIPADDDPRTVTFAPKVQEIPAEPATKSVPVEEDPTSDAQKTLRGYFKPGDKVGMLNDEGEVDSTHIVIPENETEEEARLRREMLEYHLNEVGHVVAEMELDDDDIDFEDDAASSEYLDEDTPYTTGHSDSEDEEEDKYGRTTKRVLSDDYHKQMKELEQRLIGNLGPSPATEEVNALDPDIDPQDVRRLVIRAKNEPEDTPTEVSEKSKSNGKKRVSFAEALDVATETPEPAPIIESHKARKTLEGENAAPIIDDVAEHTPSTKPSLPSTPAKTSRFKKSRAVSSDESNAEASEPAGKILADQLVERPTSTSTSAPDLDNPDPLVQRRELAAEYYRKRNAFIKERGGFKGTPDEDDADGEMMESDGEGGLKKVSRFRAARLRGL